MILLPLLIVIEALLWMLDVGTPGDTTWLMWLWLTLGVYLALGDGLMDTVRSRARRP